MLSTVTRSAVLVCSILVATVLTTTSLLLEAFSAHTLRVASRPGTVVLASPDQQQAP